MLKYETNVKIRTSDVDRNDYITPTALLELFQDIAGEHADQMGIGFKACMDEGKVWMVVRNKIEILKNPDMFAQCKVVTWPEKPGKIEMNRDYELYSLDGELLAQGVSKWVYVDYKSRRIMRAKSYGDDVEFFEKKIYEDVYKIEDFDIDGLQRYSVKTQFSDLDHNGHVNNARYYSFILNACEELQNKKVTLFEINYVNEVSVNSILDIVYIRNEDTFKVKGLNGDKTCFIAEIKTK